MKTELQNLYDFIEKRTYEGLDTSVQDVCNEFPKQYQLNAKESNFSNCPNLYKDIDLINDDFSVEKIIIKDNNNFKLATKEEAEKYAKKLSDRAISQFKKYWNVQRKIDRDRTGKIDFTDEDNEISFISAFVNVQKAVLGNDKK